MYVSKQTLDTPFPQLFLLLVATHIVSAHWGKLLYEVASEIIFRWILNFPSVQAPFFKERRSNTQFFEVFFCYFIKGLTSLCSTTLFYSSVRNINGDSSASMLTFERARTTSFSGSQLLALMARKTRARLIFGQNSKTENVEVTYKK